MYILGRDVELRFPPFIIIVMTLLCLDPARAGSFFRPGLGDPGLRGGGGNIGLVNLGIIAARGGGLCHRISEHPKIAGEKHAIQQTERQQRQSIESPPPAVPRTNLGKRYFCLAFISPPFTPERVHAVVLVQGSGAGASRSTGS